MVTRWKQEFLERSLDVFKKCTIDAEKELEEIEAHITDLERKIGQLTYEVDWLKKSYRYVRNRLLEKSR